MSKKQIIKTILFLIIIIVLIVVVDFIYSAFFNKISFENSLLSQISKTNNNVFSIDKITFFSSCNANSKVNSNSSITLQNLYQYTDIALFINNNSDNINYSARNTLKEAYIEDISFVRTPSLGEPALYYQNLDSFATGNFLVENKIADTNSNINNTVKFDISDSDTIDYSSYSLYNNCSNPITLSYINSNVISEYTILNTESLTYNGTLLKTCNIPISSLNCAISFNVFIINNLNEKFKCPVYFEIPLYNENKSISDGNYIYEAKSNFIFYEIF